MNNYFANTDLLKVPSNRAAFSDRAAWFMAEMSRLAYFRFEGGNNIDAILDQVRELFPDSGKVKQLEPLLRAQITGSSQTDAKAALSVILKDAGGFQLVETFVDEGTDAQGFMCHHPERKMVVLAFRGTEPNLKDIKADMKAKLATVEDGDRTFEIHSGYLGQFQSLKGEIGRALEHPDLEGSQLFLTGHSLGGALAITATKFLASDITGACYTFGSPPVGTKDFDSDIKTPIYRIINHVDIVPRLPNPILLGLLRLLAFGLEMVLAPFTGLYSRIKETKKYARLQELLLDAQRYRQSGYGSYLVGKGTKVRLRYDVGMYTRFKWWTKQFRNIFIGRFKFISDHSIEAYSRKLATWAEGRN